VSAFAKFYFRPSKGEWIHTIAAPDDESECGIYGRVEEKGKAVRDALVLLFKTDGEKAGPLLSAVTTDDEGEFAFGPLADGELYLIKIFRDSVKLRELEIKV
jgi:hypothetical protein